MDPLFCYGSYHELKQSDLYAHPSEADSEKLHKIFNRLVAHIAYNYVYQSVSLYTCNF